MPYLRFELDAIPKVAPCARAAKVPEGVIAWGLIQTWEYCWREKRTSLSETQLEGFFGTNVTAALRAFGFLEDAADGLFPVAGADKYLRISERLSAGGKAASGNLKRGKKAGTGAATVPEGSREIAGEEPEKVAEVPRLLSGLTASSEQRAANSEQLKEGATVFQKPADPPADAAEPSLVERLTAAWLEVRGSEYLWNGYRDGQALHAILQAGKDDWNAIEAVWRKALAREYPRCRHLKDLADNWSEYAGKEPDRRPAGRGQASDSGVPKW
jgi:hypothetical protein